VIREAFTLEKLSALEPREAAAYFISRRAEGFTSSEQQMLAAWLGENEVHRRVFESADRAWQSFAEPQGNEILAAMRAHALAPQRQARAYWRPAAAVAATLLVAVGATLLLGPNLNSLLPAWQRQGAESAAVEYSSRRGEVKELALPDGSSMTLDADSAAVGRFNADGRTIELQRGRAFFAVKQDRSRPFAVMAAGKVVVAVGTRFDVNLAMDGMTVTLLDGRVGIDSADRTAERVTLEPGQQYIERLGAATVRTIGAATENVTAWRVGLISFDDLPLAEAAAVMNRYSNDQIVIDDPAVASIRVSGQFRAGEAQRFAATLAEMHKLQAVRRANQIELVPRK